MNKLAAHLQQHLAGEVSVDHRALEYFSTDGSVLELMPKAVVYPQDYRDVIKLTRFSWQLAEQGKHLPITARGKGTDQAGAALGSGIMLVFPAHMQKMIGFDKNLNVIVQPGMIYGDLQRTLHSHGRFLPPFPTSMDYATIGGALANNSCGEKTPKYGCTADYVQSLQVILANGQQIEARKLSKRELNHKKGQTDFEGDIYRKLDGLLLDNKDLIASARPNVSKNAAGYNLWDIKAKDGSFDMSKLLVGSQGTLGIITEAMLRTVPYQPDTYLLAAFFDSVDAADEAVPQLLRLKPSSLELVDYHVLKFLQENHPKRIAGIIDGQLPKIMLLIEFDDPKARKRKANVKNALNVLKKLATRVDATTEPQQQELLWGIRHSAAAGGWHVKGAKEAAPFIEDGVVPVAQLKTFIHKLYELFEKHHLDVAISGHAGDANLHLKPLVNLNSTGDRQLVFKLMDEFYAMVISMGGSTTGEHNDGRLRGAYLKDLYGEQMYELFRQVKLIFDPYNILNPGVKVNVDKDDIKQLLRHEYSLKHLYDHMPYASHQ